MRNVVFRVVHFLFTGIFLFTFLAQISFAEGVNYRSEYDFTGSDSSIFNKTTNESYGSTFSRLDQQYQAALSKALYPYLNFSGGALYELDQGRTSSQGSVTKINIQSLRPFADLNLSTPFLSSGLGYRQQRIKEDLTGVPTMTNLRDYYSGFLGYRVPQLPSLNLRFTQTHTYDDPSTVDFTEKLLSVNTDYSVFSDSLKLAYFYTRQENMNNIEDFSLINENQNGSVDFSHSFFNRRVMMDTSYRINVNTLRFQATANMETILTRSSGLSGIDDTPEDGPALLVNNALIDGNLSASSGLDIGLAGDETTDTNMGLDFGFPVEVDKVYIWVDRDLPSEVTNSFSWTVFSSPDNTDNSTWTLVTTVAQASFGVFDNRFEISFPPQTTRYIKIVVQPLSPVVTGAGSFPNIFITEVQAFQTSSGRTGDDEEQITDQNYSLNLLGRLSDRTTLGYNLYFNSRNQKPYSTTGKRTETSNDIYVQHLFNKTFSGVARVSKVDDDSDDEKTSSLYYSLSMRAAYLATLSQTLTCSMDRIEETYGRSERNALFLRTNAILYSGWSAFIDIGYSKDKAWEGIETTKSRILRSGTNMQPLQNVMISVDYSSTRTKGAKMGNIKPSLSKLDLHVLYSPFPLMSLNGRFQIVKTGFERRTLRDYSLNWSPFPDGAINFNLIFSQIILPETGQETRVISPNIKWSIAKYASLDLFYNIDKSKTNTMIIDSRSLIANLRLVF